MISNSILRSVFLLFLNITVCYGQQKDVHKKQQPVDPVRTGYSEKVGKLKTLARSDYKLSYRIPYEEGTTLVRNDTVIRFSNVGKTIRRESFKSGENRRTIEVFDDGTLKIISEISFFYNFPIGTYRKYDHNGVIIEEINYEKEYKLGVDSIINLVKTEFNVDLSQKIPGVNVTRGKDSTFDKMVYTIFLPIDSRSANYIIIDANDGKILSNKKVTAIE